MEQLISSQEVTRRVDCVFRCLSLLCHYTCFDKAGRRGWGLGLGGGGGEIRNVALAPFHLSMKRSRVRPLQAPPIGPVKYHLCPAVFRRGLCCRVVSSPLFNVCVRRRQERVKGRGRTIRERRGKHPAGSYRRSSTSIFHWRNCANSADAPITPLHTQE